MRALVLQLLCGALAAWVAGLVVRPARGRANLIAGAMGALVARIGYAVVLGDGWGLFDAPFDLEALVVVGLGGLAGLMVAGLTGALRRS